MSRSTPNTNHDFDRLVIEARLQRTAAAGTMLVDGAVAIGNAVKSVFGLGRPQRTATSARHA